MVRTLSLALLLFLALLGRAEALCTNQTSPSFTQGGAVFGFIAPQWKQFFQAKVDKDNGSLCNATITGSLTLSGNLIVGGVSFSFPGTSDQLLGAAAAQAITNKVINCAVNTCTNFPAGALPAFTGDVTTPPGSTVTTLAKVAGNAIGAGAALDALAGFASNGLIRRTGAGAYTADATLQVAQFPALTGAITTPGGSFATTLANGAVANANFASMGAHTVKANVTGSTAAPTDTVTSTFLQVLSAQRFIASGTYTPTSGIKYALIQCKAGGGAGGSSAGGASAWAVGGGGGEGAYGVVLATAAQIGASQTVTIAAGGTPGAAGNNAGGTGGTTSVGTLCSVTGGVGGAGGPSAGGISFTGGGNGGNTGTTSVTLVHFLNGAPGGNGGASQPGASGISGNGGGAGGAAGNAGDQNGFAAAANGGGGGSGGLSLVTNRQGGAGGSGVVEITEYGAP